VIFKSNKQTLLAALSAGTKTKTKCLPIYLAYI